MKQAKDFHIFFTFAKPQKLLLAVMVIFLVLLIASPSIPVLLDDNPSNYLDGYGVIYSSATTTWDLLEIQLTIIALSFLSVSLYELFSISLDNRSGEHPLNGLPVDSVKSLKVSNKMTALQI